MSRETRPTNSDMDIKRLGVEHKHSTFQREINELEDAFSLDDKNNVQPVATKVPWMGAVVAGIGIVLSVVVLTFGGRIGTSLLRTLGFLPQTNEVMKQESTNTEEGFEQEIDVTEETTFQDPYYHLLLLGIEQFDGIEHADAIKVISIQNNGASYLTYSFLGDLYVTIPGYGAGTLKEAYQSGGGTLLSKTIEENFALELQGYVAVDCSNFVKILKQFDSITLTLSQQEADTLNQTNYITDSHLRTMKEGVQEATGEQILGYCRMLTTPRKETREEELERQQRMDAVVDELTSKLISMSTLEAMNVVNDSLPYIRTNMTKEKFKQWLTFAMEQPMQKKETLRIPMDGMYQVEVKALHSVYIPNLIQIQQAMQVHRTIKDTMQEPSNY